MHTIFSQKIQQGLARLSHACVLRVRATMLKAKRCGLPCVTPRAYGSIWLCVKLCVRDVVALRTTCFSCLSMAVESRGNSRASKAEGRRPLEATAWRPLSPRSDPRLPTRLFPRCLSLRAVIRVGYRCYCCWLPLLLYSTPNSKFTCLLTFFCLCMLTCSR